MSAEDWIDPEDTYHIKHRKQPTMKYTIELKLTSRQAHEMLDTLNAVINERQQRLDLMDKDESKGAKSKRMSRQHKTLIIARSVLAIEMYKLKILHPDN